MREPEAQQNQLISGFENQNPFIAKFVCTDMEFDFVKMFLCYKMSFILCSMSSVSKV